MFEFEVNHGRKRLSSIPEEIIESFQKEDKDMAAVTLMPWEEHCTECAMPMCYSSCHLYEARDDGKCRRFIGGITSIVGVDNYQNLITRISFKRWGQLMAYANLNMVPISRARYIERILYFLDSIASRIPDKLISIKGRKGISSRLTRRLKQSIAEKGYFARKNQSPPDYLLLEIFNPNINTIDLTLTINSIDPNKYNAGYQELLQLKPGMTRHKVDVSNIIHQADLSRKFGISLNPNILDEIDEGLTLYFGLLTFAWSKSSIKNTDKPYVKVVVWDLDNTIWDGVLVEDGAEKLKLKPGIIDIIKKIDKRGILNSIVSKNNQDDVIPLLEKFGLSEYILYPQVGWEQKGQYVKNLIKQFNVAENTFAFIDDQPFERDQVLSINPHVRAYDAADYVSILKMPEFNPPLSSESHLRREFYRYEKQREQAFLKFDGEYLTFLKGCQICLTIYRPNTANLERVLELVQRTNQLNFSGNRYSKEMITQIFEDPSKDAYCMDCQDKYGKYGTVGFAIVDKKTNQLIDLMFSCRIQSKRVEHAFLSFLLKQYKDKGAKELSAIYAKSDRNMKAGAVFDDMNFNELRTDGATRIYAFDLSNKIPDDNVINVHWNGGVC